MTPLVDASTAKWKLALHGCQPHQCLEKMPTRRLPTHTRGVCTSASPLCLRWHRPTEKQAGCLKLDRFFGFLGTEGGIRSKSEMRKKFQIIAIFVTSAAKLLQPGLLIISLMSHQCVWIGIAVKTESIVKYRILQNWPLSDWNYVLGRKRKVLVMEGRSYVGPPVGSPLPKICKKARRQKRKLQNLSLAPKTRSPAGSKRLKQCVP